MTDADELVRAYILRHYREDDPHSHLATCPETVVVNETTQRTLFYDTGVDGVAFDATVRCPHMSTEYEFGELGDLPDILAEMADDADGLLP